MRFFRAGLQKPTIDADRALKNGPSVMLNEYIIDQLQRFNDMQLSRAIFVLSMSNEPQYARTRVRV